MARQLNINIDSPSLATAFTFEEGGQRQVSGIKPFVIGDTEPIEFKFSDGSSSLNVAGYTIRIGIGGINARPEAGSFTFDDGSDTATIPFDSTAAQVKALLDAMNTGAGAYSKGDSAVFGGTGGPWFITLGDDGAVSLPTIDVTGLDPESGTLANFVTEGDVSTKAVIALRVFALPLAYSDTFTIDGNTASTVLNLATRGLFDKLAAGDTFESFFEVELTDPDGDISTVARAEVVVTGEVLSSGADGSVDFSSFPTLAALDAKFATANTLWVSKSGNDDSGTKARFDLPFLTVTAAQTAAASGDTIIVLAGDYSAETIGGKDGVFYWFTDGAIGPAFNVATAITVKGRGLCQSLVCGHAGAVMDMPGMDTVTSIYNEGGTQIAGNAGEGIECIDGTQTAGNAGTSIYCESGTQNAGNAGTYIECNGGTQTAGNAGTSIDCGGGTQTVVGGRNAVIAGGTSTILGAIHTALNNSIAVAFSGAGNLRIKGSIKAVTGTSKGINIAAGATGTIILDNCTIESSGVSIDAADAQTVIVQGTLNVTQDVDADVTIVGGSKSVNTAYRAF